MREVSAELREVIRRGELSGGVYKVEWLATLLYDGSPQVADVPLLEPSFSWDGGAQIQGKGSCRVLWSDVEGKSIVPRRIGDLFSPFGAELQVDVRVSAGDFAERVPMGRFVLDEVPEAVEYAVPSPVGGAPIVAESRVSLSLSDYFLRVARDRFAFPSSPRSSSMWEEAQRLTGLPVVQSIPDRVVPMAITYEEDRLDALEKIFAPSNAWPTLTATGALTALPKEWGPPVDEVDAILASPVKMRSETVYNRVVVEGRNPDGDGPPLRAVAEIKSGILRVRNADGSRSPFGGNTYRYSSDLLHTQTQCERTAEDLLAQVSRLRGITRDITEPLNPLREVGDVLTLIETASTVPESRVRVKSVAHSGAETKLTVEVADG